MCHSGRQKGVEESINHRIMEDIIITVLALALGLGFKVIEKKLKSAGKPAKAGRFKELAELFGEEGAEVFPPVASSEDPEEVEDGQDSSGTVDEQPRQAPVTEPVVVPSVVKPVVAAPVPAEEAPRSVKPVKAPILQEEEPEQKERIDPKKLIVYSEIMKPKYLE